MATDICVRRLTKELKALHKDPLQSPRIVVMPMENNILQMHYVIEGSEDSPFKGGVYHGKLIFPKDYPLKPPSVMMLTPSGRFQPNRRLCLSMSDFHPESWNPMWSVSTILTGLYSFMIETAPTLGSVETSTRQKRQFAKQSLDYNMRDPNFKTLFPEYLERHAKELASRPQEEQQRRLAMSESGAAMRRGGNNNNNNNNDLFNFEMQGFMAAAAGLFAILSIALAMRFF